MTKIANSITATRINGSEIGLLHLAATPFVVLYLVVYEESGKAFIVDELLLGQEFHVSGHRFSSSDYAELTEHSCFTDYARNLNGFGLTAIGLAH